MLKRGGIFIINLYKERACERGDTALAREEIVGLSQTEVERSRAKHGANVLSVQRK